MLGSAGQDVFGQSAGPCGASRKGASNGDGGRPALTARPGSLPTLTWPARKVEAEEAVTFGTALVDRMYMDAEAETLLEVTTTWLGRGPSCSSS